MDWINRIIPKTCTVLITTRDKTDVEGISGWDPYYHKLAALDPAEGVQLLEKLAPGVLEEERAGHVCEWMGHWPLALQIVGDYLANLQESFPGKGKEQKLRAELDNYIGYLDENRLRPDPDQVEEMGKMSNIIHYSVDRATSLAGRFKTFPKEVLALLSYLPLTDVTWEALRAAFQCAAGEGRESNNKYVGQFKPIMKILDKLSLLKDTEVTDDCIQACKIPHALVHDYCEQELKDIPVKASLDTLVSYYTRLLEQSVPEKMVEIESQLPHILQLTQLYIEQGQWNLAKPLIKASLPVLQSLYLWDDYQVQLDLQLQHEPTDRILQAASHFGRGFSFLIQGEYREALGYFLETNSILTNTKEQNHPGYELLQHAYTWLAIGVAYRSQGQHKEAIEAYQKALALNKPIGNLLIKADNEFGIGISQIILKNPVEAKKFFGQAKDTFTKLGDSVGLAYCAFGLGHLCLAIGEYGVALSHFKGASHLFKTQRDISCQSYCLVGEGESELMKGHYQEAQAKFTEARKLPPYISSVEASDDQSKPSRAALGSEQYALADQYYHVCTLGPLPRGQQTSVSSDDRKTALYETCRRQRQYEQTRLSIKDSPIIKHIITLRLARVEALYQQAEQDKTKGNLEKAAATFEQAGLLYQAYGKTTNALVSFTEATELYTQSSLPEQAGLERCHTALKQLRS